MDLYAAQELISEIGPRAEQFASWVGVCPGSRESAGVNYSHRAAKGNRYLRRLVCQIGWAAIHTKRVEYQEKGSVPPSERTLAASSNACSKSSAAQVWMCALCWTNNLLRHTSIFEGARATSRREADWYSAPLTL